MHFNLVREINNGYIIAYQKGAVTKDDKGNTTGNIVEEFFTHKDAKDFFKQYCKDKNKEFFGPKEEPNKDIKPKKDKKADKPKQKRRTKEEMKKVREAEEKAKEATA